MTDSSTQAASAQEAELDYLRASIQSRIDESLSSDPYMSNTKRRTFTELHDFLNDFPDDHYESSLPLLRVYSKYLSSPFNPKIIQNVIAALNGSGSGHYIYDPATTRQSSYEAVEEKHLVAYLTIFEFRQVLRMAVGQIAARNADRLDHIIELINRGIIKPEAIFDSLQNTDFGHTPALIEGAL